jgi:hypothetical protein
MTVDIEKLKALALAATPGPWEVDTVKSEGHYGTDEDGGYGYTAYVVTDGKGRPLMDSLNRDDSEIHEEYSDEEHYAWDELAKRDAQFIAAANPAAVLELIAEVERLRAAQTNSSSNFSSNCAAPAAGTVEKDAERPDWRALGYVKGATVRQWISPERFEDAVITCAHGNGALDVEIDGKTYGWSASFCTPVAAIEAHTKQEG